MRVPYKTVSIVIGATALSTIAINATDTMQGISTSLVGLVAVQEETSVCGEGMVPVSVKGELLCVDTYEASASEDCPHQDPNNTVESKANIEESSCEAISKESRIPWRYVTQVQAQELCVGAGKRLPTSEEWYRAAIGTPDNGTCNTHTAGDSLKRTGVESCASDSGVYDMIGNVWEWVDESVQDGQYKERELPEEGFVTAVDTDGVALETNGASPDELYDNDYHWIEKAGLRGVLRGGFHGSRDDGGIYSLNASVDLSFASPGIGFRCVRDIN